MKKVMIVAALICLWLTVQASAQFAPGLEAKGLKMSLNLSNFTGSDVSGAKTKTGIGVGGYVTFAFSQAFAVQPEILYMMKGAKYNWVDPFSGATVEATDKLDYLEIPVLAKWRFATKSGVRPNIFAGPSLSILLSAKTKAEGVTVDVKDFTKSTDFGLMFGTGVDVPVGPTGNLTFEGRYTLGLTSIDNSGASANIKNSNISFFVGYGF